MTQVSHLFYKFKLTPEEQEAGHTLGGLTITVLHNLRTDIAEQKLNLTFTPNDVLGFTQQESYLKGQLDMLSYLIDASETNSKGAN